ncbi:MAG: hypothetical protein AAFV90_13270 [Cyanobacteria bacterium J06634_5]
MRKIIQKSLTVVAIATTSIATTASGALAQAAPTDATVNFTGTVGSVCLFSNTVNGTLGQDGSFLSSGGFFGGPTSPGSAPGSVDLDCTGDVSISVGLPQDNGSTTDLIPTANNYAAGIEVLGTGPASGATAFSEFFGGTPFSNATGSLFGPFSETLEVGMNINTSFLPEGAYNYNVVVTAIPQ